MPSLGRFLTPDPIPRGSANPYDYANQDPVNAFDLEGTCSSKTTCARAVAKAKSKVRKAVAHLKAVVLREKMKKLFREMNPFETCLQIMCIHIPFEDKANEAIEGSQNLLNTVACNAGGALTLGGALAGSGALGKVGMAIKGLAGPLVLFGTALATAKEYGACG